jgi:hypothetical protein
MNRIAVMAVVVPREMENRLPESMISVEPTAIMPTNAVDVRIALRLLMLRKPGVAKPPKTMSAARSATNA